MLNKKIIYIIVIAIFVIFSFFLFQRYPAGFITGFSKLPSQDLERNPQENIGNVLENTENITEKETTQRKKTRFYDLGEVNVTQGGLVVLEIIKEV